MSVPAKKPEAAQLGERVRFLRAQRLMTQEDLAEASGLGRATVARIEAGGTAPHMRTVKVLAAALAVGHEELLPTPLKAWTAPRRRSRH